MSVVERARVLCCVCSLVMALQLVQSLGGASGRIEGPPELGQSLTATFHAQRHAGSGVVEAIAAVKKGGCRADDKTSKLREQPSSRDAGLRADCGLVAAAPVHAMDGCMVGSMDAAALTF